jgi:hypothetical protein
MVPFVLREVRRLKIFESRMMRIFGPERAKVTRGWRKLHNDEVKEYDMSGVCGTHGGEDESQKERDH